MKKFYAVWEKAIKNDDGEVIEGDYWSQYNSIQDAAQENEGADIYVMTQGCLASSRLWQNQFV